MSSDPAASSFFDKLKNRFSSDEAASSVDRLHEDIETLHDSGKLDENEYYQLDGLLAFQDKIAREVMVPRPDVYMVDVNVPFKDNLAELLHEPYSRIPVYDHDKDKIVGVIHIRTVLRQAYLHGFDQLSYEQVMFKPLFAPETINLSELLVIMQKRQQQLAILTDEFGGVVGIATLEDLIEEIVGDIDDEVDHAQVLFNQLNDHEYVINGKMPLDDFNDEFETDLEKEDVDTVAGYVITELGVIPSKGERLSVKLDNGMILTTRRMKGSRLQTVLLTIPTDQTKEE